jgi:hypothetical protein
VFGHCFIGDPRHILECFLGLLLQRWLTKPLRNLWHHRSHLAHAEKTLAALESWIENHDPAVAEYEIDGRRMKYIAIPDLLTLRDRYRREVRGQSGRSARVYMRF